MASVLSQVAWPAFSWAWFTPPKSFHFTHGEYRPFFPMQRRALLCLGLAQAPHGHGMSGVLSKPRRQQQAMQRFYERAGMQPPGGQVGTMNNGTDQLVGGPDPALLQALQNSLGRNGQNEAQAQVEPPAEVLVSQMTNMGFSREDSIEALQRSGNNVNAAVERLLSQ